MNTNQRLNVVKALHDWLRIPDAAELTDHEAEKAAAALRYCIELLEADDKTSGAIRRMSNAVDRVRLRRRGRDGELEFLDGSPVESEEADDGEA